jgi:hypothetical protein
MRSAVNIVMKMGSFILRAMVWRWSIEVLDGGSHALDQRRKSTPALCILYVYESAIDPRDFQTEFRFELTNGRHGFSVHVFYLGQRLHFWTRSADLWVEEVESFASTSQKIWLRSSVSGRANRRKSFWIFLQPQFLFTTTVDQVRFALILSPNFQTFQLGTASFQSDLRRFWCQIDRWHLAAP